MSNCIFISVRANSSRLPFKAMREIVDKPTIFYLIDSLKKSKHADRIILCTTEREEDTALCDIATENGISFFRGANEDKLVRWKSACEEYGVDFFVNVDGDDLLFDCGLADLIFEQNKNSNVDFIDGHGLYNDAYGISYNSLKKVCDIKATEKTEYIRPYFTETDLFDVQRIQDVPECYRKKNVRMTLDYEDDLVFFESVIKRLLQEGRTINFQEAYKLICDNPELANINFYLDEKWKKNQENINKPILKESKSEE